MASVTETQRSLPRLRWLLVGTCLVAVAGWFIAIQLQARSSFRRGLAALDADDPAAARPFLDRCLATWPTDGEAHFRAAQAARRCGDFPETERHLLEAEKLGWSSADIELERALVQVQSGNLADAEYTLRSALERQHPESPQILAVLVPACMAEFRWYDALALAKKWTELRPESAKAWGYLGEIFERLLKKNDAVNAYRESVRLNPNDRQKRLDLARMLVQTRQPEEAVAHLEWLADSDPNDSTVTVLMGMCREMQGQREQAVRLFERAMGQNPQDAKAFYQRGRLELNAGKAASALPFLRRAAELDRSDPEILYSQLLCLQEAGTADQVREAEDRWKRCEADLKRVNELARRIAVSPHDPNLRREMGELFLRNGRDRDGVRWLESALREQPDHPPTHRLLAEYYERQGQWDEANYHRKFFQLLDAQQR